MKRSWPFTALTLGIALLWSLAGCTEEPQSPAGVFDHTYKLYGELLADHVDADGWVDYTGLIADSLKLRRASSAIAALPGDSLATFSRAEALAYYINAYNLLTLESVAAAYPVSSIQDIDGVWDRKRFHIGGRKLTLNDLEHRILRPQFREPRIHFAIVCAAISCPALLNRPYRPDSLEAQLAQATQRFLNDPAKNTYNIAEKTITISAIFDWFGKDFIHTYRSSIPADQSESVRSVLNFLSASLPDSIGRHLLEQGLDVGFKPYNWLLNKQGARGTTSRPDND